MAEAVFLDMLKKKGTQSEWRVDSAGHGNWHLGKTPEPRTLQVLAHHGINGYTHKARLITNEDFYDYEYILGMDEYNLQNLQALKPDGSKSIIQVLGQYDPKGIRTIFDPYFSSSITAYEEVYRQCLRSCEFFLESTSKHP